MITFLALAGLLLFAGLYHAFILPRPATDRSGARLGLDAFLMGFGQTFRSFFGKPGIVLMLLFLLVYRLGESLLVKTAIPFLRDPREAGGAWADD